MKTQIVTIALMLTIGILWFGGLRTYAMLPRNGGTPVTAEPDQREASTADPEWRTSPIRQQDACSNPDDIAIIYSGVLETIFLDCTTSCLGSPDFDQCVSDCLVDQAGLSEGCADCFGALSGCTVRNCFGACSINPTSPECLACLEAAGCTSDFEICSGLGPIFADGFESGDTTAWD